MAADQTSLHSNPDERKIRSGRRKGPRAEDFTEAVLRARREAPLPPRRDAPLSVTSTAPATSVSERKSFEIPEHFWPIIDATWTTRHRATAQRWRMRARRHNRARHLAARLNDEHARIELGESSWLADQGYAPIPIDPCDSRIGSVADERRHARSAAYATARARTVALDRSAVVAACGARSILLECGCGRRRKVLGCDQPWICDLCRRKRYGKLQRRAMRAICVHLENAKAQWAAEGSIRGKEPRPYLVTFTVPRRGSTLDERRAQLILGWKRFRQWLHLKIGKFAYVGMPELAAGRCGDCQANDVRKCEHGGDGEGHLHLHFVVIWPWWDWSGDDERRGIHEEWRAAIGDDGANPPHIRSCHEGNGAKQAARYVAKYATKGANYTHTGIGPELLAEMVAIYYGKRRTLPSVGFWGPCRTLAGRCPVCERKPIVIEWPVRLARVDPQRAWVALGRAMGIYVTPRWGSTKQAPWRSTGPLW